MLIMKICYQSYIDKGLANLEHFRGIQTAESPFRRFIFIDANLFVSQQIMWFEFWLSYLHLLGRSLWRDLLKLARRYFYPLYKQNSF